MDVVLHLVGQGDAGGRQLDGDIAIGAADLTKAQPKLQSLRSLPSR